MIISRTPFRISFAGGGSDLPSFYHRTTGAVLSTSIDKYMYIAIHPFFDQKKIQLKYSKTELVDCIDDIHHPIFREVLKMYQLSGVDLNSIADIPSGTGLGSSSAFTVGLLNAVRAYLGKATSGEKLGQLACDVEIHKVGSPIGKQDQYAAAFGGFNYMEFLQNDLVIVNPLKIKRWIIDELEASMVLYFTGASRSSAAIIDQQRKNTSSGNQKAIDAMHRIKQSAIDMKLALLKGDMQAFAKILGQGWEDKKKMAEAISNPMIQEVFDVAIPAGALAGKVSGAGGGGFIMLMVEPTRKKEVINALKELDGFVMPFQFTEGGAHGWKIYSTDKI